MISFSSFLLFVLLLFSGEAEAADSDYNNLGNGQDVVFVDNRNPTCSDSHSRSQAMSGTTPWCSITKAVSSFHEGDTVYVSQGTYRGYYVFDNINFDHDTKFTNYPGETPTLTSAKASPESAPNSVWTRYGSSSNNVWVTSDDSLTGSWYGAYTDSGDSLFTYSNDFSQHRSLSALTSSSNPEGIYYDDGSNRLFVRLRSNRNPNSYALSISDEPVFTIDDVGGAEFEISGFYIRDSERGIVARNSQNVVLDNNRVRGGLKGIDFRESSYIEITDNTVELDRNSDWTWEDDMKASAMETSGLWLQRMRNNVEVSGNTVSGHFNGIMTYSDNDRSDFSGIKVHDNTIFDIFDDAIEIERYCNGGRYYDNMIYDSFVGISLSPVDATSSRCYIEHNVIIADKLIKWDEHGTTYYGHCYKIVDSDPVNNMYITGNTCVGQGIFTTEDKTRNQKNILWRDNIFYATNDRNIDKSGLASDNVVYDYNLYYRQDGGAIFRFWNSDSSRTEFSSLNSALNSNQDPGNWDRHSEQGNPLFNNLGSYDLRPKENSPACSMSSSGSYVGALPCLGSGPSCGDGSCNGNEDCSSCSQDCGSCSSGGYLWLEAEYPDSMSSPMRTFSDPTASEGKYIKIAEGAGTSGEATFEFSVERNNDFYIWGRVYGPDGQHNSFHSSVGDSGQLIWEIEPESDYTWQRMHDRDTTETGHSLNVGNHELTIQYREYETRLDKILITSDAGYTPSGDGDPASNMAECGDGTCDASESCTSCSSDCGVCPPVCGDGTCEGSESCSSCSSDCGTCLTPEYHWLESEFADSLVSPMTAIYDQQASHGYYISVPDGSGGEAAFDFQIDKSGEYYMWGRVNAPDMKHNSFYAVVDSQDRIVWEIDVASGWTWQRIENRDDGLDVFPLSSGNHQLTLENREENTNIDKILITNVESYTPSNSGYAAENLPTCGDSVCSVTESCSSCASDCGSCSATCGDGTCSAAEDCFSCASDCGSCPAICGDGTCDSGEDCNTCNQDCGICGSCGDGLCDVSESCSSCSNDCGTCSSGGGSSGGGRGSSYVTPSIKTTECYLEDGIVTFTAELMERNYITDEEDSQSITVLEIMNESISFQLRSSIILDDTISIGEEKEYDMDNITISVALISIGESSAELTITEIIEVAVVPAQEPVQEEVVAPVQPKKVESPIALPTGNVAKEGGSSSLFLFLLILACGTIFLLYYGYDASIQVYRDTGRGFTYILRSFEDTVFWCVEGISAAYNNIKPHTTNYIEKLYAIMGNKATKVINSLNKPSASDISSMKSWVRIAYKNGLDVEFVREYLLGRGWDQESVSKLMKSSRRKVPTAKGETDNLNRWFTYITAHLNNGFELDYIRNNLVENLGYDEQIVEFIFQSFQKGTHG